MFMFLRIERPTTATLRPFAIATSAACCTRWMFDANDATTMRPVRSGMSWRNASPTSRSEPVIPGRSAFVESPSNRSTPRLPSAASAPTSVFSPSTGVWSSFQSPVCSTRPAGVSITSATASGIECAIRINSMRNGPSSIGARPGSASVSVVTAARPCSSSFDLTRASVEARADHLGDVDLAEDVGQCADVVLVGVRQDDRAHGPPDEVREVRQHQVDAEMLVAREREARVDDDALVADLEHGHVLPDLAEAAERDDPQAVCHASESTDGSRRRNRRPGVSQHPASRDPCRLVEPLGGERRVAVEVREQVEQPARRRAPGRLAPSTVARDLASDACEVDALPASPGPAVATSTSTAATRQSPSSSSPRTATAS